MQVLQGAVILLVVFLFLPLPLPGIPAKNGTPMLATPQPPDKSATYSAYAACLIGAMPKVLSSSALPIGTAVAAGKSLSSPIPPPQGILRKAPPRMLTPGMKWGFKGQLVGALVFVVSYEVELNAAAKSCSDSTGYTPWVFER